MQILRRRRARRRLYVCWQFKADVFRGDGGAGPGGWYDERVLASGMDGMGE